MNAITIHQPRATLIAMGLKTVETFIWAPPPVALLERIAIHAGRREVTRKELRELPQFNRDLPQSFMVPYGAVVATARLVTVFRAGERTPDGEYILCDRSHTNLCPGSWHVVRVDGITDFSPGRWVWVFDRVEALDPPHPAGGKPGLWEWAGGKVLEVAR